MDSSGRRGRRSVLLDTQRGKHPVPLSEGSVPQVCARERRPLSCQNPGSPRGLCVLRAHAHLHRHCGGRVLQAGHLPGDSSRHGLVPLVRGHALALLQRPLRRCLCALRRRRPLLPPRLAAPRLWVPRVHVRGAVGARGGRAPFELWRVRHHERVLSRPVPPQRRAPRRHKHPCHRTQRDDGVAQRGGCPAQRDRTVRDEPIRVRDGQLRLRPRAQ
mmetsp:Transcript_30148/g.71504  ORF Transcript_30148/g.71504 Transcript_30148/m.71504 type:complete len:216 (-) Transcript_30148:803-1450(-)